MEAGMVGLGRQHLDFEHRSFKSAMATGDIPAKNLECTVLLEVARLNQLFGFIT